MKAKFIVLFFMFIVSFFVNAETTFSHDHTVCDFRGEEIDLDIRGPEQYREPEYGNHLILGHRGKKTEINFNDQGFGRYRMVKAYNDICPKVLSLALNQDEVVFFFMKDNRPMGDELIIVYYNVSTQDSEVMATKIHARTGILRSGKAYFKLAKETPEDHAGIVMINNAKFHFIEKPFEPWVSFDGKKFKLDRELTWEKFEYKNLLRWTQLQDLKESKNLTFKIAVNRELKKNCLSFDGQAWICH